MKAADTAPILPIRAALAHQDCQELTPDPYFPTSNLAPVAAGEESDGCCGQHRRCRGLWNLVGQGQRLAGIIGKGEICCLVQAAAGTDKDRADAATGELLNRVVAEASVCRVEIAHTIKGKAKLLTRVRRIRGQSDALEKALDAEADCAGILQQIAAIRGAVNGLMSEVLEHHLRDHLGAEATDAVQRGRDLEEVVSVLKSYLK